MHRMIGTALVVAMMGTGAMASVTVTPLEDKPTAPPEAAAPSPGTGSTTAPAAVAGATSQPGEGSMNMDYVNGLIDAGKNKEALQLLSKLYETPGSDKAQILMLKAECQLQLRETSTAVGTAKEASRLADQAHNTVEANEAAAFAFLMQKSQPRNLYTPVNSPEKTPIDILDRAKRKTAYQALLIDEMVELQAKIRTASMKGTLPPFLEIGHDVPALRGIERNANGGTKQADQFAKDAANAAGKVIMGALSDMDQQVSKIQLAADRLVEGTGTPGYVPQPPNRYVSGYQTSQTTGNYRHQGLDGSSSQRLQNIIDTCGRIPNAVDQLSKAFEDPSPFYHLTTQAQSTAKRAREVMMKDYNQP